MVDQPDNKPQSPEEEPAQPAAQSQQESQEPGTPPTPDESSSETKRHDLWHEPPVEEGASRPVNVEAWFKPENAVPDEPEPDKKPDSESRQAVPAPAADFLADKPPDAGAWFSPLDAKLDALFDGADETIIEVHTPEPSGPEPVIEQPEAAPASPDDTRQQIAADTRFPLTGAESEDAATDQPEQAPPTPDQEAAAPAPIAQTSEAAPGEPSQPAVKETPDDQPGPEEVQAPAIAEAVDMDAEMEPSADAEPAPSAGKALQFERVEQRVKALRERYHAGELTREELQSELRSLMILDDSGRWWMLGLESDRWYFYDGHEWVASTPPGYEERVRGSAVRTETGVQEVAIDSAAGLAALASPAEDSDVAADEDSLPLPAKVPQEDPGATLVSPNTPFLEPVRQSEAPTQPKTQAVDAPSANFITHPSGLRGAPERPKSAATVAPDQQTIQSQPVDPDVTMPRVTAAGQPRKPPIGSFPQPDYSAALEASRDRNWYVKWGIRFTVFSIIGGMALTLIALLTMIGYYLYKVDQYSEAVASLRERASAFETTLILDAQGATLAEFNNPDTGLRKEVPLNQISPWLIHATVSTENETFYTDPGFSVIAIVRAAYQNLRSGDTLSGASTITQQLARALVLETEFAYQRTAERKIVEIIVASEIKRKYNKNEILEIYLNEIFYGNFAYGIEAAAQTYFHKSASELNPAEAAFLAGLPQSPATYDPVVNREAAIQRMHTVLRLMSEANGTGCITIQHDDTTEWGVPGGGTLCLIAQPQPDGTTLYYYTTPNSPEPQELTLPLALVETATFTPPSNEFVHPHFVNYVWQQLEETYGPQAIYNAGYRVFTTLDETVQRAAETAVANQLASLQARGFNATNASVVVVNPKNGAVMAMVGSADYNNEDIDGQVNIAFTAQQPGSAMKPFVYLAALIPDEEGRYLTPASVLWDVQSQFGNYVPVNYDRQFHGPKTVREALANSLNIPAVKTLEFTGVLRFTELATRFGIRFPLGNPVERNAGLPTALGAVEVRLFDMVSAFGTLANGGVRVEPFSIVYIEDSKGNEIFRASAPQGQQVVPPEYAYLITDILSDGAARADEFGRGWPLELSGGRPAAVKTGTSNDSRDVWTIGYTPQYAVGVWVGNSDNTPMGNLTGYFGAAPIWFDIMETAHAGLGIEPFVPPAGIIQAEVCIDTGTLPSPACAGRTYVEIFANTAPPPGPEQGIFQTLQVDSFTGKLANEACADALETRTYLVLNDRWAYDWLNNDPAGQAWLAQHGLQAPLEQPPTDYCDPNEPRPQVIVANPPQDTTVQGIVQIFGTVTMAGFNRYEIRYGIGHEPTTFSEALIVDFQQRPDANSLLGQLDTRVLENGPYTLRLIAYDQQGRHAQRDIRIFVNNPLPTPLPPVPTPAPTLTLPIGVLPTPTLAPSPTPQTG